MLLFCAPLLIPFLIHSFCPRKKMISVLLWELSGRSLFLWKTYIFMKDVHSSFPWHLMVVHCINLEIILMGHVNQSKILKYVVFAIMIQVLLDCGAVQADALTVDRLASLEKVWTKTLAYQTSSPFLSKKWK